MPEKLVMLGAGGAARELYWFAKDTIPGVSIVFVDDASGAESVEIDGELIPVVADWRFPQGFERFVVAVAEPRVKRILVARALESGLVPSPTLVHPRAIVRPDCTLGVGGMIVAHSQLTTHATIGDYVLILDSTVGHHDVVGDYTTCFPGCKVSGDVVLGADVLLGAGTVIRNGVRVADGVVTGASACVVRDIDEPGVTVAGVPAKKLG